MEYNSTRDILKFPEYGRHVQQLVDHLRTIENPEEQQAYAEKIVELMYFVDVHERNNMDGRDKLWKHLFKIAEYDLKVVPPNGEIPNPEDEKERLERMEYPQRNPRHRHYGNNVAALMDKAKEMEDPVKREAFLNVIGSYMKLAYKNWNKEHYVNDEIIRTDIRRIVGKDLEVPEDLALDFLTHNNNSFRPQQHHSSGKRKKKSNNNNYRNKRKRR